MGAFFRKRGILVLAIMMIAGLVWLTAQDLQPFSSEKLNRTAAIVLVQPQEKDGVKKWVVTEVLKGGAQARQAGEMAVARLAPPVNGREDSPLTGAIYILEPRYVLFGPVAVREVLAVYGGRVGTSGLTLEEFRELCAAK